MATKVKVFGKAQNRTALGIMHAYLVMNPHATMQDFEKAFPKELNPDSGWPVNFKDSKELKTENEQNFWFKEADEVLALQDGTKMTVVKMWTKGSFENLVKHAKQYDIEVAAFEKGQRFEKGGFRLEYLNGYVPPVAVVNQEEGNKKSKLLWILLLLAILVALAAFLLPKACQEPKVIEKEVVVEKTVVVHDTLYVQQIAEIEKNYNAAEFEKGKSELSDEAKFVLHDLAKVMTQNPELRLRLEGHTSAEGDADFNQKLSEARAKAAVDFLITHEKIDANRLEFAGKGSTELKNSEDPMAAENRRTEFIVLE